MFWVQPSGNQHPIQAHTKHQEKKKQQHNDKEEKQRERKCCYFYFRNPKYVTGFWGYLIEYNQSY